MNLVEQLGGYEKASEDFKKLHLNLKEQQKSNKIFMDAFDALKTELLEYRRQHNIFEESDKIVFIDDFMHGELMVVAWTRKGEVWMDEGAKRCTDLSMIRHATDAEIAAGKRLEVS